MGKRQDALGLLRNGLDPIRIARHQGVSLNTILGYLDESIGKGELKRSDIFFSVDKDRRVRPQTPEYRLIISHYGSAAHALGDMYEVIRNVEITLHERIREALEYEFGSGEEGWWRKGLSLPLRQKLMCRREEDEIPGEAYTYTDLIDLADILEKNWSKIAVKVVNSVHEKQKLLSDIRYLNRIRRKVMHPVRSAPPEEDEFEFVRGMMLRLKVG
jgi:hypothetical protein